MSGKEDNMNRSSHRAANTPLWCKQVQNACHTTPTKVNTLFNRIISVVNDRNIKSHHLTTTFTSLFLSSSPKRLCLWLLLLLHATGIPNVSLDDNIVVVSDISLSGSSIYN